MHLISLDFLAHFGLGRHVVFGNVTEGMDVVKAIERVGTRQGPPTAEVRIADAGQH